MFWFGRGLVCAMRKSISSEQVTDTVLDEAGGSG